MQTSDVIRAIQAAGYMPSAFFPQSGTGFRRPPAESRCLSVSCPNPVALVAEVIAHSPSVELAQELAKGSFQSSFGDSVVYWPHLLMPEAA